MLPTSRRRSGLTLLELILVVFILAAVAVSAISITSNADDQLRFEETRSRVARIRAAVIGPGAPDRTGGGTPLVAGFVADFGRLPSNLEELLSRGTLAAWSYDASLGLWGGWRGPYVEPVREIGGALSFRDGWGSPGDPPGHGWKTFAVDLTAGTLTVQSFGSDGAAGGSDYAVDYPPSGPIVERADHEVNLKGWPVTIEFVNASATPSPAAAVRLRLHHPENGRFDWPAVWPANDSDRDKSAWLSEKKDLPPIAAGSSPVAIEFRFETGPAGAPFDKYVPWGLRALAVVADGTGARLGSTRPFPVRLHSRSALPDLPRIRWELP